MIITVLNVGANLMSQIGGHHIVKIICIYASRVQMNVMLNMQITIELT